MRVRTLAALVAIGLSGSVAASDVFDNADLPEPRYETWDDAAGSPTALDRPKFHYFGAGWATLDGWLRGDPLLRNWVLTRYDIDRDGWLTEEEAATARTAFYALADADGSGTVSSAEFVAGWRETRRSFSGAVANREDVDLAVSAG